MKKLKQKYFNGEQSFDQEILFRQNQSTNKKKRDEQAKTQINSQGKLPQKNTYHKKKQKLIPYTREKSAHISRRKWGQEK